MHKIFLWAKEDIDDGKSVVYGYATSDEGEMLMTVHTDNRFWLRSALGITRDSNQRWYKETYPEGYELVNLIDYTDDELDAHTEFMEAISKGVPEDASGDQD